MIPVEILKPAYLFISSATLTVVALHFPTKFHCFFLLPTWLLAAWSLASVTGNTGLTGVLTGLNSYTAITELRHSGFVWPSRRSISAACRIWNNPRKLDFRGRTSPSCAAWSSRLRFALLRGLKAFSIVFVDRWIVQLIRERLFIDGSILDFAPDQHHIIRPLVSQLSSVAFDTENLEYNSVTGRQISLRAFMSLSWIWFNFMTLECYHAILAVFFVAVLRLDDPDDWPPLFGSLADAWTIRRFWGRFWHRIATPTFTKWAEIILRVKSRTAIGNAAVAFGVFFLSGLMHATAAWRTGQRFADLDIWFFCANFLVVAVEILVSQIYNRVVRRTGLSVHLRPDPWLCVASRTLGFIWVFTWFFWAVPRWIYPKTLRFLIKEALIQSENPFL
ncbi:toxin biosynthesis protein [Colletotrichum truncatum]|uniref:Toxin biosynthesis protein n=1 Tax=Colletotrichum truncatum TaxID=5467 RepID=A0ACC3YYG2_COLTU|nr:toxin biosynthesis protein [Colletotrichum truncatum]KAF6782043.1 toxin biosynthesis protein [Colletotrichum truncatum]